MTPFLRTVVYRPVLVTVVYLIVVLFGSIAYNRLSIDVLPEVQPPVLTVVTAFPGASAVDVESKITRPIEDQLGSLSSLDEILSTSRDNVAIVTLVFDMGHDLAEAATDVRSAIERLELPDDADPPRVLKFDPGAVPAVVFAVTDATGDVRLQRDVVRRRIVEPIERLPGVGSVVLANAPDPVVRVDVDRDRLVAIGLTLTELARILAAGNVDVPAGTVDVGATEFAIRMPGQAETLRELRDRIVQRSPLDGSVVRLGDVATVTEGLDDTTEVALIDGQPAMTGIVFKLGSANTVAVSREVKVLLDGLDLPEGLRASIAEDPSDFIEAMVGNLQRTVLIGSGLVFLVVLGFLRRLGPSVVVTATIPMSLVATFMVMERLGFTLNAVTLMAMALAIGLVVDNGIVVLENITRHFDEGEDARQGSVLGAREVGGALLASTTTTLVVFVPMGFASGIIGAMFGQLSYVMITTVASSLVVALTLTPMLAPRLVRSGRGPGPEEPPPTDAQGIWERVLAGYRALLDDALKHPGSTLMVALGLAVLTVAMVAMVPTDFIPRQDQSRASIFLELPVGSALGETVSATRKVADAFRGDPDVRLVYEYAGAGRQTSTSGRRSEGSHVGRVKAFFVPKTARQRTDEQVVRQVLARVGEQPEVVSRSVVYGEDNGLGITGKPLAVEVIGSDAEALVSTASAIERAMRGIDGLVDVASDLPQTRPEVQLRLARELADRVGVPFGAAASELRAALTGVSATRFTTDGDTKDVIVRLAEEDRDELTELGLVPVRARSGRIVQLADLAITGDGESAVEIRRLDKSRVITISAGVEGRALGSATADVQGVLDQLDLPPGTAARMAGTSADQAETFRDLALLGLLGLLLVYLVMAAQFESWIEPMVILLSVPFAVTGAFLALLVTGTTLGITSFLGLIILIGVVVNNAIVLLDYARQLEAEGLDRETAVRRAGEVRLRPVLITTLTTAGGMLPLAAATGIGAELWSPMGRTAFGGLMVSTLVTLVLVPVFYVLVGRWSASRSA